MAKDIGRYFLGVINAHHKAGPNKLSGIAHLTARLRVKGRLGENHGDQLAFNGLLYRAALHKEACDLGLAGKLGVAKKLGITAFIGEARALLELA